LLGGLLLAGAWVRARDGTAAKNNGRRKNKRKQARRKKRRQRIAPPPSGPITRVDATCPINTGSFLITTGDQRIAQTFTTVRGGPFVRADLEIFKKIGSIGDYILRLSTVDASGVPTNEVLAASVVPNNRVPDLFTAITFSFANPATVVANTQYALVLTRPGSDQLESIGSSGDPCAGRTFISSSQTAPFAEDTTTFDMTFTTFVVS
jgi:hypothetical protein